MTSSDILGRMCSSDSVRRSDLEQISVSSIPPSKCIDTMLGGVHYTNSRAAASSLSIHSCHSSLGLGVWLARLVRSMAEGPERSGDLSTIIDEAALGYARLKKEQKKALCAFVTGSDVFVSPYRIWQVVVLRSAATFDVKRGLVEKKSIVMVVSPLIALMKDQSSSFTRKGINSVYVSDNPRNY